MAVSIAVAFGAALRSKRLLRGLAGEEKALGIKSLPTNYLYNLSGTDRIAAALKFTYLYFTEMNIY